MIWQPMVRHQTVHKINLLFPMSRKKPLKNTKTVIGKFLKSVNVNPLSLDLSLAQKL